MQRKTIPSRRKSGNADRRRKAPCLTMRLVIVVGSPDDKALDGADTWVRDRAKALGGPFHIWWDRTSSGPLAAFSDHDITGGRQIPGAQEYKLRRTRYDLGLAGLLDAYRNCRGRIEELVIFHHGGPVNETLLADRVREILHRLRIPVCRVVWWACEAEVSLDVDAGGATDAMMRSLAATARCRPCGCSHPVELIWPTTGNCYLDQGGELRQPRTNDGEVNRARWGFQQPGGGVGVDPPPGVSHSHPEPADRDPPYGQPPEQNAGSILGVPVGKKL
jgi:hypothetical protein